MLEIGFVVRPRSHDDHAWFLIADGRRQVLREDGLPVVVTADSSVSQRSPGQEGIFGDADVLPEGPPSEVSFGGDEQGFQICCWMLYSLHASNFSEG